MTMLQIAEVRAGDVILYPASQIAFQHSAIVVGQGNVVHADAAGGRGFVRQESAADTERYCPPIFQNRDDLRFKAEVYRCKKANLAEAAALCAQRFGRDSAESPGATLYGENRARGVSLQLHGDPSPPFEFDAIYRAFKWASRAGKDSAQFSAKQGTTCAAFVIACYQAAAIQGLAAGDEQKIEDCLDLIRSWRADKKATRQERWKARPVPNRPDLTRPDAYKRSVSNAGPAEESRAGWTNATDAKNVAADAWGYLVEMLLTGDAPLLAPAHYMTTAMAVDAQFVFTQTLRNRLFNDGNWVCRRLEF